MKQNYTARMFSFLRVGHVGLIIIFLTGIVLFLSEQESPIATPQKWPPSVRRYLNSFTGRIRVIDVKSGCTIFSYSDDPQIYPKSITELPDGSWNVVFVKQKEK
jgi:hypothetical protein